jgi:hypothetical protein
MALAPINPTQLTPPRVAFIDERSGAISREWYRFFLSLLTATETNQQEVELAPDTGSLIASYDAMLETLAQATASQPDALSFAVAVDSKVDALSYAFEVTPPDLGGTVTSVNASGGTTGMTFTGGPITTSGTLTLGGTLATVNGGTGQITYTDGQLLIGSTSADSLVKAVLTPGANISITNAAGAITIAVTGLGTMAAKNIGVSGSFIAGINTVTVVDGIITSIV